MVISEASVADVVARISAQMSDPTFGQQSIGGFVTTQPDASRFLSISVGRKVGAEDAMHAVFHATVVEACFVESGQPLPAVSFVDLDAAGDDAAEQLAADQPAIAAYLSTNVTEEAMRLPLCRVALAFSRARAASSSGS